MRYKSAPDEVAADAGVDNPTTDMATTSTFVYASEEARDAGEPADPEAEPSSGADIGVIAGVVLGALILVGGIVIVTIRQRRKSADE